MLPYLYVYNIKSLCFTQCAEKCGIADAYCFAAFENILYTYLGLSYRIFSCVTVVINIVGYPFCYRFELFVIVLYIACYIIGKIGDLVKRLFTPSSVSSSVT